MQRDEIESLESWELLGENRTEKEKTVFSQGNHEIVLYQDELGNYEIQFETDQFKSEFAETIESLYPLWRDTEIVLSGHRSTEVLSGRDLREKHIEDRIEDTNEIESYESLEIDFGDFQAVQQTSTYQNSHRRLMEPVIKVKNQEAGFEPVWSIYQASSRRSVDEYTADILLADLSTYLHSQFG